MEYEPVRALFQGFEPLFRSQDKDPGPHQGTNSDPDPHQIKYSDPDSRSAFGYASNKNQNPDPHQSDADKQHWLYKLRIEPWRAVDTHSGGLEAQNGAL
jgi:hypothetical protein